MISHVILLNPRNNAKVNQQIVDGKYLVLNAPWCRSFPDTIIKREDHEIYIESKNIICKISNGKTSYLETVYSMDKAVRFTELMPSPPLCDFFLAKRYFLDSISGRKSSAVSGDESIAHLQRRRPMRFVIPVLSYIFRTLIEYLLAEVPEHVIEHITNQPIGVKQNTAIKMTLGTLARAFCSLQRTTIRLGHPAVFINGLYLLPTYAYLFVFSSLYSALITSFMEVIQLLNNSSYNPLKKRRDSIILTTDQIFMSVLIFSFYLLIIMNVICFHAFFIFVNLCLVALNYAKDFVDFFFIDTSHCSTYDLVFDKDNRSEPKLGYRKVLILERIVFAMEASFYASDISKDRFFAKLFFGTQ